MTTAPSSIRKRPAAVPPSSTAEAGQAPMDKRIHEARYSPLDLDDAEIKRNPPASEGTPRIKPLPLTEISNHG
jgi:hypothetical protein